MNKKRSKNRREIVGAPEIAHPDNKEEYERQLAFIYAWFFEMWKRVASDDKTACGELQILLLNGVGNLLRFAQANCAPKKWSGMMLAKISGSIEKYDEKLCETNVAYCDEKKKIGKLRTDVLFPGPIGEIVQRELKKSERYRKRLMVLEAVSGEGQKPQWLTIPGKPSRLLSHGSRGWKEAARSKNIPEAYWDFAELPEFTLKSEPKWWKYLWPRIKENNPDFLRDSRTGKFPTRGIRRHARWSSYRREFRNCLRTLAGLRSAEVR